MARARHRRPLAPGRRRGAARRRRVPLSAPSDPAAEASSTPRRLARIEVVEDRSARSTLSDGFLRLRRLLVRNHYADGSTSASYPCDMVTRRSTDAVALVLYGTPTSSRVPHVVLRTGVRPPVYLRRDRTDLPFEETADLRLLTEIVAGILEQDDVGTAGLAKRAAAEALEEAGFTVAPEDTHALGAPLFPSPGVTDEKVYFRRAEVDLTDQGQPVGDGSVMEEAGEVIVMPLDEAIHQCRSGAMPDAKTELALLRLCDAIGWSLALGAFYADLPEATRPDPARLAWLAGEAPTA